MTDELLRRLPRRRNRPTVGKVLLLREIGRGAMGVVFAGWHQELDTPVAVKLLLDPETASPERLARFQREARICAELDDPALVRVIESGQEAGWPYFVMEWVPGRGLDFVIRENGPLQRFEVLTVVRDVGQALMVLHRKGVLHRDIKPSNLLLRAADGRIKIADLGVAKDFNANDAIQTQAIVGTPVFMSPEQIQDPASVYPGSDLFSLGSTAFTLLTGRLAFGGNSPYETMFNVCHMPLPDPRTFGAEISEEAWKVLQGLTEKEPRKRIATAEALLECLPGVSVPLRTEVLAVARPAFEITAPQDDEDSSLEIGDRLQATAAYDLKTLPEVQAWSGQGTAHGALLFCQCLQNDFLEPPPPGDGSWSPPNKLHVGRDEALRLVGPDPAVGPLVRAVSACARDDNVRIIHIRDWHDANDPKQRPELDFFGEHCLMGTRGSRFIDAIEAFSRDRRRAAVVDAGGINDIHDTPILPMLEMIARPLAEADANWRARVPVGVIGVWTDVKVHYLLYDLKTRAGLHNLATCSALIASPNRQAHEATLGHLKAVLNVKVFDRVEDFLDFLGVSQERSTPSALS